MDAAIAELQNNRTLPESEVDLPDLIEENRDYDPALGKQFCFAESSECITTLDEASTLLKLDELKVLAKDALVQGKTKSELIRNLRRASKSQSGLRAILRRSETEQSSKSNASN